MHYRTRSARRALWLTALTARLMEQRDAWAPVAGCRLEVRIGLPFARANASRDPSNYGGGAGTCKPIIDALTSAGAGIVPDDTPRWVRTTEPVLYLGTDVVVVLTVIGPGPLWDPTDPA